MNGNFLVLENIFDLPNLPRAKTTQKNIHLSITVQALDFIRQNSHQFVRTTYQFVKRISSVCQEGIVSLSEPKVRQKSHQSQRDQLTSGVSEVVRAVQSPQLAGNLLLRTVWAARPLISTQPPLSASHNNCPTVASRPKHWGRTKGMKHYPPAFAVNTTEQPATNATKTEWIKDAYFIMIPPAFYTMPHDIYKHQGALKLK